MNLDGSRLATGDVSGKIMIWDTRSGQILVRLNKNGNFLYSLNTLVTIFRRNSHFDFCIILGMLVKSGL